MQSGSSWRTTTPSAITRAWTTDFRGPHPSLPYPIILFDAASASAEYLATTIGPRPDECRWIFWTIQAMSYLPEVIPDAIVPGVLGGHNFRINDRLGIPPATKLRTIQMRQRLFHECSEENAKLMISIQWQNVGNVLIGSHDDECSPFAVDAAQVEDIVAVPEVGTI